MTVTSTSPTARPSTAAKVLGSLGVLAAAAAVAGLGAFGAFTDSTTPAVVQVASGVTSIDLSSGGAAAVPLSFGGVLPGGVAIQAVDLVNDGDTALSSVELATTATSSSLLDTDARHGLQMSVQSCSVAWSASWSCAGEVRTVLASGPVVRTAVLDAPLGLTAGGTDHLAVSLALPDTADDTFKGQSSELQLVFTAVQRDGSPR